MHSRCVLTLNVYKRNSSVFGSCVTGDSKPRVLLHPVALFNILALLAAYYVKQYIRSNHHCVLSLLFAFALLCDVASKCGWTDIATVLCFADSTPVTCPDPSLLQGYFCARQSPVCYTAIPPEPIIKRD